MFNIINIIFILYISLTFLFSSITNKNVYFELINYTSEKLSLIPENEFTSNDFINTMIDNIIYTRILIGEPKQDLIVLIDSEEYSYFIFKDICIFNSFYNQNLSKTFKYDENNEKFYYKDYSKALYINESIELNININKKEKIVLNNFPIMFMKSPLNDDLFKKRSLLNITGNTCFTLGFKFIGNNYNNNNNAKNFLSVLSNKNIINDNILFIEYDKNGNEQYLILGEYPEWLDNNRYSIKNEYRTNIKIYSRFKTQWGIEFNKIYSKNISLDKTDTAFHHNLGVIYGTDEYKNFIEEKFFEYYINIKICYRMNNELYLFYFCDKEKFEKEKKYFPEIKMIKIEFGEELVLNHEDLFYSKGNNTYFLVVFHYLYNEVWELGKPFLKKYSFAYNFENKIIHYYSKNKNNNENININNDIKNNKIKNGYIYIYFILFISFFIGIFFFFIGKRYYNRRKKNLLKAQELEKNFSYIYNSYNNINNNTKLIADY